MTYSMTSLCAGKLSDADFCAYQGKPDHYAISSEKRSSARYAIEEPVILETDSGELIGAVISNYGQCGLYFESDFRAQKGTILKIRNESALSKACLGGCEAKVCWTRKIDRANSEYNYGTGVQYC